MTISKSLRTSLGWICALALLSCSGAPTTIECLRYEAGYIGPDNQFKLNVPTDTIPALDGPPDRLTLAVSVIPSIDGQATRATLIHVVDGNEVSRWKLRLPAPNGISSRCVIASTRENSNCGASLTDLPMQPGGRYRLETDSERLLEAGLSFRVCE